METVAHGFYARLPHLEKFSSCQSRFQSQCFREIATWIRKVVSTFENYGNNPLDGWILLKKQLFILLPVLSYFGGWTYLEVYFAVEQVSSEYHSFQYQMLKCNKKHVISNKSPIEHRLRIIQNSSHWRKTI